MRRMVAKSLDTSSFRGRVAQALRDALIESGMSQEELAEKLQMKPSNLSALLSGKLNPTVDKINQVMVALGRQVPIF